MNFEEALKAMRKGKKVRNGQCACTWRINSVDSIVDSWGDDVALSQRDIFSDEWEIVE